MQLISLAPEHFMNADATNFPQYITTMPGGAIRSAQVFSHTVAQKMRSIPLVMPYYEGILTLKILFAIEATSGNVEFNCAIEVNKSINNNTVNSYATANASGAISANVTTFNSKSFDIVVTNTDSVVEGDTFMIAIDRNILVASNITQPCYFLSASLWDEQ